jgi:hypothetical protein
MKFGVRECANIVFRAKTPTNIGKYKFKAGQPVLYIDSATTSTVEQSTTSVYARGGRGNVRLISWEGEKTLTFTVEDALLSPISLAMLSGADLFQGSSTISKVHFHTTSTATMKISGTGASQVATIDLSEVLGAQETLCSTNDSPIFVIITDDSGDITGEMIEGSKVEIGTISGSTFTPASGDGVYQAIRITKPSVIGKQSWAGSAKTLTDGEQIAVFVDYYLDKNAQAVDELQIAADNFAGNYYVEADTLFRRKKDGIDMPANLTFPNVKIQSNLSFSLSSTGDPSTFTFTMDALPGYTYFDKSKEVLCVIQVIEDQTNADKIINPIMPHNEVLEHDSTEIDDSHYIGFGTGSGTTKGNAKITITGASNTVEVDGSLTLTGASIPDGATITWSSSDTTKATVSDGTVSGVAVGTVTITASAEGYESGTYTVTVVPAG